MKLCKDCEFLVKEKTLRTPREDGSRYYKCSKYKWSLKLKYDEFENLQCRNNDDNSKICN